MPAICSVRSGRLLFTRFNGITTIISETDLGIWFFILYQLYSDRSQSCSVFVEEKKEAAVVAPGDGFCRRRRFQREREELVAGLGHTGQGIAAAAISNIPVVEWEGNIKSVQVSLVFVHV